VKHNVERLNDGPPAVRFVVATCLSCGKSPRDGCRLVDAGICSGRNQSVGHGIFGEVGFRVQPELFCDTCFMKIDRFDRNAKDR
jgi:hypothetical protein